MANTYNGSGLTSVSYGVSGVFTGLVVQSTNISTKNGVEAKVLNELGQEVVRRYDDLINEISIDAVINGATLPVPGAEIVYPTGGTKYELVSIEVKNTNKGFATVSMKAKNSANITDA